MQKTTTLLALFLLVAVAAVGQAPFTITAANFPVYQLQSQSVAQPNSAAVNITPSANGYWDISSIHGTDYAVNNYVPETDPFYTSQGVDVYIDAFKSLIPGLGYGVYYEYDFNNQGVFEEAIYVSDQRYGLGALTGNNADSIIIPFQTKFFATPRQVMKFPATYLTGWSSNSRRVVDMKLSIAAAGLNQTPTLHVYNTTRTDTIIGWGQMRIYNGSTASIPYNVLINKSIQNVKDSFYIAGTPAPPALLNVFGITQGQTSSSTARYLIYREGYSAALAIFNYGSNSFQVPTLVYLETENLATSDVQSPEVGRFSTLLFPNPSTSGDINILITGDAPEMSSYRLIDLQGRTVQYGQANTNGGVLQIRTEAQLAAGTYVLQVLDAGQQPVIMEQVVISK